MGESASINLSKMNELFAGKLPWHLSFSYGKALQKTCIVSWLGQAANKDAAQKALKNRAAANTEATLGKYKPGTCASVGTDGNIKGAAGPYSLLTVQGRDFVDPVILLLYSPFCLAMEILVSIACPVPRT